MTMFVSIPEPEAALLLAIERTARALLAVEETSPNPASTEFRLTIELSDLFEQLDVERAARKARTQ